MPKGKNPNSLKNLKRGGITTETASALGRKGAIASNKKQAENKAFREMYRLVLNEVVAQDKVGNDITAKAAIVKRVTKMAMDGNLRAVEYITDMVGEGVDAANEQQQKDEFKIKIEGLTDKEAKGLGK